MTRPRFVTFTTGFFADLDRQLPAERRPGVPSRTDFLTYELGTIREWFSTRFEDLMPAIRGRSDYRELVTSGRVVAAMSVVGQLMPDGTVEVLELMLSLDWPAGPDTDSDGEESP